MRSGFVAIVGRPNVGKSTLLNEIVGEKVAITTPVPQTTRHAVRAVLHRPDPSDPVQVVFVDTPGLHKAKTLLGSRLNEVARGTLSSVDLIIFLVDGAAGLGRGDEFIVGLLEDLATPVFAVLNKTDLTSPKQDLPQLQRLAGLREFAEIVPVSAATGAGVDTLVELIVASMGEGPAFFPEGQVSDQTTERLVAEIIREQVIAAMREEVPHSIAVVTDELGPGESDGVTAIQATIYVERESQKGIVIGKGGAFLAAVGTQARAELEVILGTRVWLDLRVKLAKEWQRDPKLLQRFGY